MSRRACQNYEVKDYKTATTGSCIARVNCKISQKGLHVYTLETRDYLCYHKNHRECFLRCFCSHLSRRKNTKSPSFKRLLWLCVFVLFEPRLAVFCGPWIKLHDAETLGGQTGDSTHTAVRGGEITLLVCLFQEDPVPSCWNDKWLTLKASHSLRLSAFSVSFSFFSDGSLLILSTHLFSLPPTSD